jgi:hypothetical protein
LVKWTGTKNITRIPAINVITADASTPKNEMVVNGRNGRNWMRNRHLRRPPLPYIFSAKLVAHLILVNGTYDLYKIFIGEGFSESKTL